MVVWALLAPFAIAAVHFALVPLFRRVLRRQSNALPPVPVGAT